MIHSDTLKQVKRLFLCVALFVLLPLTANAEDQCDTIGKNSKWTKGMDTLIATMQANDMKTAKSLSKDLVDICPNAPMLNYLQAKIAEALGENADALYYYQKASENTYTFAVDPDNAKKIWYARYEMEHPERSASAVASSSESMNALEKENAQLKDTISQQADLNLNHTNSYKKAMWAGIGVGIGGLALAGGGVGLVMSKSDKYEVTENKGSPKTYTFTNLYTTGWTLIGVGAAFTVGGAILAGVFGSKYASSKNQSDYSFSITPMHASFTFRF